MTFQSDSNPAMRNSTSPSRFTVNEAFACDAIRPFDETAMTGLSRSSVGNDATYDDAAGSVWLASYELEQAAQFHRALVIRNFIVAMIRAAGTLAARAHARYLQHREARGIRDALGALDDRTLLDLGFHRSEIASVAAEVTGRAERTRVRVLQFYCTPVVTSTSRP